MFYVVLNQKVIIGSQSQCTKRMMSYAKGRHLTLQQIVDAGISIQKLGA
jgi:hypothetical protein